MELANCMRVSDRSTVALAQIEPRDEKKAADESEVLEERVLNHEALRWLHFPKSIRNEGGEQRESCKPQGAEPAVDSGQDERGTGELGDDRRGGSRCCEGESEALRLGHRGVEVEELVKAALNVCGAEAQQCNEVNRPRRDKRSNCPGQTIEQGPLRQRFCLVVSGIVRHRVSPGSWCVSRLVSSSHRVWIVAGHRAHRTWLSECCPLGRQSFIPRLGDSCAVFETYPPSRGYLDDRLQAQTSARRVPQVEAPTSGDHA